VRVLSVGPEQKGVRRDRCGVVRYMDRGAKRLHAYAVCRLQTEENQLYLHMQCVGYDQPPVESQRREGCTCRS